MKHLPPNAASRAWSQGQHFSQSRIEILVDTENETLTFNGRQYHLEEQLAAIVQCLVEANGVPRTRKQIKELFPRNILHERPDKLIKNKLRPHSSGIGGHIRSDHRGYWLDFLQSD